MVGILRWAALLFSALVTTAMPLGQTAPGAPATEQVDVRAVSVPVFVTDKKGDPVTGLGAADFQILEDGAPVEISSFSAFEGPAPDATPPPLKLVLYVDSLNIRPLHRNQVFRRLRPVIEEQIDPEVPVMLVVSGDKLRVLTTFDDSRAVTRHRFEELTRGGSGGLFDAAGLQTQLESMARTVREVSKCLSNGTCDSQAVQSTTRTTVGEIRNYSRGVNAEAARSLERLQNFCRSLALVPGVKSILLVSDGFPLQAGQELLEEFDDALRDAVNRAEANRGLSGTYQALLDIVSRSGLESFSRELVEMVEKVTAAANAAHVRIYVLRATALAGAAGHDDSAGLRRMADTTGGEMMEGSIRTDDMLDQMRRDLHTYYLLGYDSPHSGDERYHEIRVKAKPRRSRVRHPHGYLGRGTASRRTEQILAALFYGHGENPQEILLDVEPGPEDERQLPTLRLRVRIPLRFVEWSRGDGVHRAELQLLVGVMAPSGRITTLREYPVPIEIPSPQLSAARAQEFPVTLTVPAGTGNQRVAVGLWPEGSNVGSFITTELDGAP